MEQAHGRPAPLSVPEQGDDHGKVRAGRPLLQPAQGDQPQGVCRRLSGSKSRIPRNTRALKDRKSSIRANSKGEQANIGIFSHPLLVFFLCVK